MAREFLWGGGPRKLIGGVPRFGFLRFGRKSVITQSPSLTVRMTIQTDTKVGGSDPALFSGQGADHRIKDTPRITG